MHSDARHGQVIVLNGTSSAGKTTLARALQDRWDGPLLDAGLDRHLSMLPRRYLGAQWSEVFAYDHAADGSIAAVRPGPQGHRLVHAMHRSVAALSRSGADVVVDHVLLDPAWAADLEECLGDLPGVVVGVVCPTEVLREREAARKDRTLGQALAQLAQVHAHGGYDVTVDTSSATPEEAADAVLAWLAHEDAGPVGASTRS